MASSVPAVTTRINRMRAQADFLAKHEEIIAKYDYELAFDRAVDAGEPHGWSDLTTVSIYASDWYVDLTVGGPKAKEVIRELRQAIGGKWEKQYSGSIFRLVQSVEGDPLLEVRLETDRDAVCEAKVVGTEVVDRRVTKEMTAEEIAATDEIVNVVVIEKVEQDIIEWDCGNLLEDDAA